MPRVWKSVETTLGSVSPKARPTVNSRASRKIQLARQRHVSVPGFVELKRHLVVLSQIGVAVAHCRHSRRRAGEIRTKRRERASGCSSRRPAAPGRKPRSQTRYCPALRLPDGARRARKIFNPLIAAVKLRAHAAERRAGLGSAMISLVSENRRSRSWLLIEYP